MHELMKETLPYFLLPLALLAAGLWDERKNERKRWREYELARLRYSRRRMKAIRSNEM